MCRLCDRYAVEGPVAFFLMQRRECAAAGVRWALQRLAAVLRRLYP